MHILRQRFVFTGLYIVAFIVLQSPILNLAKILYHVGFLGVLTKLLKATISFVMFVCLLAWKDSAPNQQIFMKFYASIFRKSVEKMQVSLISDKNNRYLT